MKLLKFLIILFLTNCSGITKAFAVVYSTTGNGDWTDVVWIPSAPPNPLANGDAVNILHNISLDGNITIDGNLNIDATGNLSGSKNIVINAGGQLTNNGAVSIDVFTNHGTVSNNNALTASSDMTNDGTFTNNAAGTIDVLNSRNFDNRNGIFTNIGTITIDHDLKNDNGSVTNNGTMNVNHSFDNKNGSTVNNGNVIINNDLVNNPGIFTNNGQVTVGNNIKNKDGVLDGTNGNYIVSGHLDNNDGTITGSVNVCKPDGTTNPIINGGTIGPLVTICAVILPVELVSFNADNQENNVVLTWTTASENNSNYFMVERSADGKNFEAIEKVKGAGVSGRAINYSLIDRTPLYGISYYRLKQNDFDGRGFDSKVVSVVFHSSVITMKVYPNPVTSGEEFSINFSNPNAKGEEVLLTVYDMRGKTIFSKAVLQNNEGVITAIDPCYKLSAGVYLVMGSSKNEMFRQKLVVIDPNNSGSVFVKQ